LCDAFFVSSRPGPDVALQQPTGSGLPHKDEAFKDELVTMLGRYSAAELLTCGKTGASKQATTGTTPSMKQ
jgi:hypothetical protein